MFTNRFNERQCMACAPPRDSTPFAARFGLPHRAHWTTLRAARFGANSRSGAALPAHARLLAVALAWAAATGLATAQNVIIGDTGSQTVGISGGTTPYNTLILGNTATGNGTLNFSGGTIDVTHVGGYSGFVTVGKFGIGNFNHSNENGNAVINITGPAYVGPAPATPPDPWGGYLFIGRSNGGSGTYTMTDWRSAGWARARIT